MTNYCKFDNNNIPEELDQLNYPGKRPSLDLNHNLLLVHRVPRFHMDRLHQIIVISGFKYFVFSFYLDHSSDSTTQRVLHLHGLHHGALLALTHLLPHGHADGLHHAGHRRQDDPAGVDGNLDGHHVQQGSSLGGQDSTLQRCPLVPWKLGDGDYSSPLFILIT